MYRNVCLIALIFLSLENVSGLICLSSSPRQESQPENIGYKKDTQMITCFHRYQDDNQKAIMITPQLPEKKTTYFFYITVEKFDDNTEIYCVTSKQSDYSVVPTTTVNATIGDNKSVFNLTTSSIFHNKTIIKVTSDTPQNNEEHIKEKIYYNRTTNVLFSCPNIYKTTYIQLGVINTSTNIIEIFKELSTNKTFNEKHDRAILCCIYYVVNGTGDRYITRYVTNKKMLIYDNGKNNGDKYSWQNLQTGTVSELMISNSTSTASTNLGDIAGGNTGNQFQTYIIATAAVAAVFILIATVVVCKKRCRKKPKSEARVLYADLDMLRQAEPGTAQPQRSRPGPEEESPYAQIIGEMRPQ